MASSLWVARRQVIKRNVRRYDTKCIAFEDETQWRRPFTYDYLSRSFPRKRESRTQRKALNFSLDPRFRGDERNEGTCRQSACAGTICTWSRDASSQRLFFSWWLCSAPTQPA